MIEVYICYVYIKSDVRKNPERGNQMPEWATISIREELIEEIRKLMKRTGRYRSISEFVAEAIRLRLEEMASKGETVPELLSETPKKPSLPLTSVSLLTHQTTRDARGYINVQLQRLEQIWWILVRLFGDLVRKDAKVDAEYARQLRNCRTLINFIRSHTCPECEIDLANERLPDLQQILENVKCDLIATAICVSSDYAQEWISEINRVERGWPQEISVVGPRFVPDLPRNSRIGWTRITLSKPVPKERVEEMSRVLGVLVKAENDLHFVVRGEKETVKKAVEMLYQMQSR
jgi:Arc/MetJ-type ribon-helix-helix transcriptional regulator